MAQREIGPRLLALWLAITVMACSAPVTPGPSPTLRLRGPAVDLILPVTAMPQGTRIASEGALSASDLDEAWSGADPGAVARDLSKLSFEGAYYRTFGLQKPSGRVMNVECILALFPDADSARAMVAARGKAMLAYGYRAFALDETLGDADAYAVTLDGRIPSSDQLVTSVRVMFSVANVVIQTSIQDDSKLVDPRDAVNLARNEIAHVRRVRNGTPGAS